MSPINCSMLVISEEDYNALSKATKNELEKNGVSVRLIPLDNTKRYYVNNGLVNLISYFNWMWEIIWTSEHNKSARDELDTLKRSISNIKDIIK